MSAVFSKCRTYRYRLERGKGKAVAFYMVNPSTAGGTVDDPTIRRCRGFAERLGYNRIIVGNKFAFRSPHVSDLRTAVDPIGPNNDRHLAQIMRDADLHIVAWGTLDKLPKDLRLRWHAITRIAKEVGVTLQCLGVNHDKHPRHPLMTSYEVELEAWKEPWYLARIF